MIDPFPNDEDTIDDEYNALEAIKFAVPGLISAMRHQLIVKSELLEQAYDDFDYRRFLIAPSRFEKKTARKQRLNIPLLAGR
jgi:hypothetical protein